VNDITEPRLLDGLQIYSLMPKTLARKISDAKFHPDIHLKELSK
jgi:hypothetical protein